MIEVRAGGHITLLFTIEKKQRLFRDQGSRGIGFSIDKGVKVIAKREDHSLAISQSEYNVGINPDEGIQFEEGDITFYLKDMDGNEIENTTMYEQFVDACRETGLIKSHESFVFEIHVECPISQGFGMSAAGLIALGRAIKASTGRGTDEQFLRIAHRVERMLSGGLGDVLGASVGGVELRLSPGAPGWPGRAVSFEVDETVLLVWNPTEHRHTSNYIDDEAWMAKITAAGQEALTHFSEENWTPDCWHEILSQSKEFGQISGLESELARSNLLETIQQCIDELGYSSAIETRLCMLGNSAVLLPASLNSETNIWIEQVKQLVKKRGLSAQVSQILQSI